MDSSNESKENHASKIPKLALAGGASRIPAGGALGASRLPAPLAAHNESVSSGEISFRSSFHQLDVSRISLIRTDSTSSGGSMDLLAVANPALANSRDGATTPNRSGLLRTSMSFGERSSRSPPLPAADAILLCPLLPQGMPGLPCSARRPPLPAVRPSPAAPPH